MATFGQVVADTLIGAFAGQKYRDDSNTYTALRNAVAGAVRPDIVASAAMGGSPIMGGLAGLAADALVDRNAAQDRALGQMQDALALARGEVAKLQLEAVLGQGIGPDAPITTRVFEQMGSLANLSAVLSGIGIASEIATLGQVDRCTEEVRRYLDYSGATQLVNFGYGQILGEVLGEPMSQELRAVTGHGLIGLNDLITLQMRRDTFDPAKPAWDQDLLDQVRRYGLNAERAGQMLQAYTYYPQVQDWIRFAVRDVFSESAVTAGRYDDAFPADILPHARKAGVSDQVLKWYWRAHWDLPSPTMGYEMLHRGVISESDLDGLLRLADYAPGWVDKMIAISYQPLTRIDARRMYADGIIDRDRYLRAMMDLGYRREEAELFVRWTDEEAVSKTKDLTAAQTKKAYSLGLIMEEQYRDYLTKEGYDAQEVQTLLELDLAEQDTKRREQAVKLAVKRYKYKITDQETLKSELQKAGVKPERLQALIDETVIEKRLSRKLPTKADVLDWLKKGVVTGADASARLSALGYSDQDVALYLRAAALGESSQGQE